MEKSTESMYTIKKVIGYSLVIFGPISLSISLLYLMVKNKIKNRWIRILAFLVIIIGIGLFILSSYLFHHLLSFIGTLVGSIILKEDLQVYPPLHALEEVKILPKGTKVKIYYDEGSIIMGDRSPKYFTLIDNIRYTFPSDFKM